MVNLVGPIAVKFVWMLQGDWLCPGQRGTKVPCWTNIFARFAPYLTFEAQYLFGSQTSTSVLTFNRILTFYMFIICIEHTSLQIGVPYSWCHPKILSYTGLRGLPFTRTCVKGCLFVDSLLVIRASQPSCLMEHRKLRPQDDLHVKYRALHLTGEQALAPMSSSSRLSMLGDKANGSQDSSSADHS